MDSSMRGNAQGYRPPSLASGRCGRAIVVNPCGVNMRSPTRSPLRSAGESTLVTTPPAATLNPYHAHGCHGSAKSTACGMMTNAAKTRTAASLTVLRIRTASRKASLSPIATSGKRGGGTKTQHLTGYGEMRLKGETTPFLMRTHPN